MDNLFAVLEGILFAAGGGVPTDKLAEALETSAEAVDAALTELAGRYRFERRGIRIIRLENAWQMTSSPEFSTEIRRALELRKPPALSKAALEVLSLVAYYQPTTRAFIEQIRGVDSSSTVGILAERGLIEECGQLNVPGRPFLFRTTGAFLRSFGISALSELPEIEQIDGQITLSENAESYEQAEADEPETVEGAEVAEAAEPETVEGAV